MTQKSIDQTINIKMFRSQSLKQDWNQSLPKYWNDNSPFKTHFLNALSITLPDCEKFFIETVKPHIKKIDDPVLLLNTKEFVKQESHHRLAHKLYNDWLIEQGLPVNQLQNSTNKMWNFVRKHLNNNAQLALTICVEHITVVYASVFLSCHSILENMHPQFRQIWQWHAVEEIEHKAVTMDIWNTTSGSLFLRRLAMLLVLPTYMWYVGKNTIVFLHADNQLWKWKTLKDMISFLFNSEYGVVRRSFVPWLDFMGKKFHPNQHDHRALLEYTKL